MDTVGVLAP
jgi:hypothetical protein